MNRIPVEVTVVAMKNIRKRKLTIEVETIGEDFYCPRTMEKFTMIPSDDLITMEKDIEWMLKDLHAAYSEFEGPDYKKGLEKINKLIEKYAR